jgi:hypothetical protein
MTEIPAYFEPIRQRAAARWDQLERDPELAGPWHQLFKQVQSPRHVLSELLQNADDAGAKAAAVRIEDGAFVFEHDGEDFAEEHFASLCRFGYSNKRSLHTIGFRGIGFKSTFSLGGRVEVCTPTLSVWFDRQRFTEPVWLDGDRTTGRTRVRVAIADDHRLREIEKNLADWQKSPLSLLFFKHLRSMQVGDQEVRWTLLGDGPVPDSSWMALNGNHEDAFLLLRSPPVDFPGDALAEIRQERMIMLGEETEFPPCKVEIVLGAKGRLFVVLPTGVETALPFACNAPFIQDPARLKIKDPEISPTNRWLLQRAGELAANGMLAWLHHQQCPVADRACAYGLFPDVDRDDRSLEGSCATTVEEAFESALAGKPCLLAEDGAVMAAGQAVALPEAILAIWPAAQASVLFDQKGRPPLAHDVEPAYRRKLANWGVLEEIDKQRVLSTLLEKHLPSPSASRQLLGLWGYVAPEATAYWSSFKPVELRIVPVQGKEVLYSASEVVRLGEKRLLENETDWAFLSTYLLVMDQGWSRFLAETRRSAEEHCAKDDLALVNAAHAVLKKIGLEDSADVSRVVDRVATLFFARENISLADCIRLAQIAAKLNTTAGEHFRYATRDLHLHAPTETVLFEADGQLEELVPLEQRQSRLLHEDHLLAFTSCSRDEWFAWVASGRAGLSTFLPLMEARSTVYGRKKIESEVRARGSSGSITFQYKTDHFQLVDWNFDATCWRHWRSLAAANADIWAKIAERIIGQPTAFWTKARSASALHVASTGNVRSITADALVPAWVLALRDLACLRDTHGFCRKPSDLLRRTPETESLIDVEPFIHASLDREATRPLLDVLGVRSTPTGPDRLLACLRSLAVVEKPPAHEVERWYRRLDQLMNACSTAELQAIKACFWSEKLILTDRGVWASASSVFLTADEEDVPGAAVVRQSVEDLSLWRKIGIAERPTAELAIQWLKELPSGQRLQQSEAPRVRALLVRYPARIWLECGHWLNLAGEWVRVESVAYALTMQSLIPWSHLHEWVKQKTADLQRLPVDVTTAPPFSALPLLSDRVEDRFQHEPKKSRDLGRVAWLCALGEELMRVDLGDAAQTERVREQAAELSKTTWLVTSDLELLPYIDGTPAGTPRRADVLWVDRVLYTIDLSKAKLARRVPEEVARSFNRPEIKAALDYSFERSPDDIRAYLGENFTLSARGYAPPDTDNGAPVSEAPSADDPAETPQGLGALVSEPATESSASTGETAACGPAPREDASAMGDNEVGHDEPPADEEGELVVRPRSPQKPSKPHIIERFALARGFKRDGDERFYHEDGSWIAKVNGSTFPWERRNSAGDIVRYYWPREHCLDLEPLEVESEVWGLIDKTPGTYAFVLATAAGDPIEVLGAQLRALLATGVLKLYPAAYRLVLEGEAHV